MNSYEALDMTGDFTRYIMTKCHGHCTGDVIAVDSSNDVNGDVNKSTVSSETLQSDATPFSKGCSLSPSLARARANAGPTAACSLSDINRPGEVLDPTFVRISRELTASENGAMFIASPGELIATRKTSSRCSRHACVRACVPACAREPVIIICSLNRRVRCPLPSSSLSLSDGNISLPRLMWNTTEVVDNSKRAKDRLRSVIN